MLPERESRPTVNRAASESFDGDVVMVHPTGCPCGHLYDEDCIRHLPVAGTGERYRAMRRAVA